MKLKYFPKSIISSSLVLNFVGGMSGINSYGMEEKITEDEDYSSFDFVYNAIDELKKKALGKKSISFSFIDNTINELKKKILGKKDLLKNILEDQNKLGKYEHLFNLDYVEDLDAEFDYDCKNFSEMEMKLINIEKFLSEQILKSRKKLSLKNNLNTKVEIIIYYETREKIRHLMKKVFTEPLKKIFKNPQNEQNLLDDQIDDQNIDMRDASQSSSCFVF